MAQKNATPTKEQQAVLRKHGLQEYEWVVIKDTGGSLIICHRVTKQVKLIEK